MSKKKVVRDAGMAMFIAPGLIGPNTPAAEPPPFMGESGSEQALKRFASGATSSKCPRLSLISLNFLERLARRCELGIERRPDGSSFNGLMNRQAVHDKAFIMSRLDHIVKHAYTLMQKIEGLIPDDGEDDAGAIGWAAMFLADATNPGQEKFHDAK
jgi:hypothetical protein